MSQKMTKLTLMDALAAAGVNFSSSATLSQLKKLYDDQNLKDAATVNGTNQNAQTATSADSQHTAFLDAENAAKDEFINSKNLASASPDEGACGGQSLNVEVNVPNYFEYAASANADDDVAVKGKATNSDDDDIALDKELQRLIKRREILQVQQEIKQLESYAPVPNLRQLDFGDIEHAIPKFSGDEASHSVQHFLKNFDELMLTINADDRFKLLSLRRSLSGTARAFLSTTSAVKYEDMCEALRAEFSVEVTRADIYKILATRKWDCRNETLHRFVIEMQAIAKRANIGEPEVVDFIIDGIEGKVTNISLLMGAKTLGELKSLINRYQNKYLSLVSATSARSVSATKPRDARNADKFIPKEAPLCFNCSQTGHIKPNCPYPLRANGSCFKCWRMGHDHRSCPNPRKVLVELAALNKGHQVAIVEGEDTLDNESNIMGALNLSN